jgi:predicted lipoprotein with Yx(FWY)xxD motif
MKYQIGILAAASLAASLFSTLSFAGAPVSTVTPVPTASSPSQQSSPTPVVSPSASPTVSPSGATQLTTATSSLGTYITDGSGGSLYLFEGDTSNVSNCTGACATAWPPFTVTAGQTPTAGTGLQQSLISTITRADGTTQVTYAGHPLYHFSGDAGSPGATNGQGLNAFGALWYLVQPAGTALIGAGTASATSGGSGTITY